MAVLGDFEVVTTGGNFSSKAGFSDSFPTGGRSKKGRFGYLLIDWMGFPENWEKPASVKFYLNGEVLAILPPPKKQVITTLRINELTLYATKNNTFKVLSTNAWGGFFNVICHYHQGE